VKKHNNSDERGLKFLLLLQELNTNAAAYSLGECAALHMRNEDWIKLRDVSLGQP
jgi:hypothetical protein